MEVLNKSRTDQRSGGNSTRVYAKRGNSTKASSYSMHHSHSQRFRRDVLLYGAAVAVPGIVGLLQAPILTRLLSMQEYALYVLILSIVAAGSSLNSWVGMAVIRYYLGAEARGGGRPFFRRAVLLAAVSSGVLASIGSVAAVSLRYPGLGFGLIPVVIAYFLTLELVNVLLSFARIRNRPLVYAGFSSWRAAGGLALGVLAIVVYRSGVTGLFLATSIALLAGLPFLWRAVDLRPEPHSMRAPDAPSFRSLAEYGMPLTAAEVAAWGLRLSDRWLLQLFLGASVVAVYSATYALAEASILVVITVFQLALRPIEVRLWQTEGPTEWANFATRTTQIFLLVSVPLACFATGLAEPLIRVALPPEYSIGSAIVPWIIWSGVLLGLQHRFQAGIILATKTAYIGVAAIVSAALNIGLNLILVPKFGMIAAAVNTFCGYLLFAALVAFLAHPFLPWRFPWRTAIVAMAAGTAGIVVTKTLAVGVAGDRVPELTSLALFTPIGIAVCAAILFASGELVVLSSRVRPGPGRA